MGAVCCVTVLCVCACMSVCVLCVCCVCVCACACASGYEGRPSGCGYVCVCGWGGYMCAWQSGGDSPEASLSALLPH